MNTAAIAGTREPSEARTAGSAALDRFRASRWRRGRTALSREKIVEAASDRILRRMGLAAGIAGLIVAIVELPDIAEQTEFVSGPWAILVAGVVLGWFPVLVVVSFTMGRKAIRVVAGAAALSYLGALATIPFIYVAPLTDITSVWMYRVLALGVLAAVLAWRPAVATGYLTVAAATAALANRSVMPEATVWALVGDFARAAGLCALFLWCCVFALAAAARAKSPTRAQTVASGITDRFASAAVAAATVR